MDSQPAPVSINARRGQHLAPIQTDFSKPAARSIVIETPSSQRPQPTLDPSPGQDGERVPLQTRSAKRQSSKTSLRNLFSRAKSARQAKHDYQLPVIEEAQNSAIHNRYVSDFPRSPASPTAASTTVSTPTLVAFPTTQTPKTRNPLRAHPKSGKDKQTSSISSWEPPPLFQAYRQAIKHACLLAPTLSADSILRINASRRPSGAGEDVKNNALQDAQGAANSGARRKKEAKEKKHSRKISESISKTEWTHKIYVLVTSGYLLQYAGEGNLDRLPEKIMQLGPTSVAFASDAIPGKHWVLQISQTSDDDGTVPLDTPKTFLSRLGFQSADSRRSAKSLLLVFNSPVDMNSWLVAVRREIEALGGKKYVPETSADEDAAHQLQDKPSLRNLVKKDPNQFPSPLLEPQRSPIPSLHNVSSAQELRSQVDSSAKSLHRRSMPPRPSTDAPSMSTMPTPTDLDLLREGSRLSYVSGSPPTATSSSGSSPCLSPVALDTAPPRVSHLDHSVNAQKSHAVAATLDQDRQSTYARRPSTQADREVGEVPMTNRPQSAVPEALVCSASPPNFSVPSFSKRYNIAPGSARRQNSTSDIKQMSRPEPLSLSSRSQYGVHSEPVTPIRENFVEFQSTKAYKRLSREYGPSTAISSPPLSPAASIAGARTPPSRPRRLSSVESSAEIKSLPQQDVLGGLPQRNLRNDEIASIPLHGAPHPPEPDITNPSVTPPHHLRPMSMQGKPDADGSPPRGPQSHNMSQLRGSSSTTFRPDARPNMVSSNSTTVCAATGQNGHPPSSTKRIIPRKSMPDLLLGPPIAPPPNCPLPGVPPAVISQFQPAWRGNPVSPTGSVDPPRKNLDGRRRSRFVAHQDYASVAQRMNTINSSELDMINAF